MKNPCDNCTKGTCKNCEYILGLSREYETDRRTVKDVRDLMSYTDYDEEDAFNLVAKGRVMRGTFIR